MRSIFNFVSSCVRPHALKKSWSSSGPAIGSTAAATGDAGAVSDRAVGVLNEVVVVSAGAAATSKAVAVAFAGKFCGTGVNEQQARVSHHANNVRATDAVININQVLTPV